MKTLLLAGVAAAALTLTAPMASAGDFKPYVSVFGGGSWLTQDMRTTYTGYSTGGASYSTKGGYIIGGAVGVEWANMLRSELELSHAVWNLNQVHYHTSDGNIGTIPGHGNVNATYLLGNLWVDFHNSSRFTPYVGGGLGLGWVGMDSGYANFTQSNAPSFAFQLGAGVNFAVNEHVSIDLGYRYKDIVGLSFNPGTNYQAGGFTDFLQNTSLASHNVQVGVTFKF